MKKTLLLIMLTLFLLSFSQAEPIKEECDNGIGYSIPGRSQPSCQKQDCCCCDQKAHIHDLGEITDNQTRIKIQFKLGNNRGRTCEDRLDIYVSNDTQNWEREGTTKECEDNEKCTDSEYVSKKYRYVKLETDNCYLDWSEIEVKEEEPVDMNSFALILMLIFVFMPIMMFLILFSTFVLIVIFIIKKIGTHNRNKTQPKHNFKNFKMKEKQETLRRKPKKPGFFG
ncbi:hypothetical protein K8R43_00950 [archaeon]|nr:hypothetical protein [archaeon]